MLNIEKILIETSGNEREYFEGDYYLLIGGVTFFIDLNREKNPKNYHVKDKKAEDEVFNSFIQLLREARADAMFLKLVESNRSLDFIRKEGGLNREDILKEKILEREELILSMKKKDELAYHKAVKLYADYHLDLLKQKANPKKATK